MNPSEILRSARRRNTRFSFQVGISGKCKEIAVINQKMLRVTSCIIKTATIASKTGIVMYSKRSGFIAQRLSMVHLVNGTAIKYRRMVNTTA